jgi:hypothetical protein
MPKTCLKIDDLAVDSFDTDDRETREAGTVRAHAATYLFEGCGQTQFNTCAPTRLGAPCFCA